MCFAEKAIFISSSLFFLIANFSSTLPISGVLLVTIKVLPSVSNLITFFSFSLVNNDALSTTLNRSFKLASIINLNSLGINLDILGKTSFNNLD